MPVLTASAAIVGFVVTPRWGIPIIAVHAGVIFTQRLPVVGFAQGTAEAVDFLVSDLIIMIVIWALREGLDGVALATARALDAETRATSARHRTAIRQRFDGLVHDKVLAALTLASRGLNAEAAGLARDALTELAPGSDARVEAASDSLALITEHASLLGLELTLVADTWPSGPEGDALRAATCEALTNVLRHSGYGEPAFVRPGMPASSSSRSPTTGPGSTSRLFPPIASGSRSASSAPSPPWGPALSSPAVRGWGPESP